MIKNEIEKRYASKLVKAILDEGLTVSVWESEAWATDDKGIPVQRSTMYTRITQSLASTDSDYLYIFDGCKRAGWFYLVYGNGEDLISDYSDNDLCNRIWEKLK